VTDDLSESRRRAKHRDAARRRAGIPQQHLVDAAPVIKHLRKLRKLGMSQQSIATVSGVPFATLTGFVWTKSVVARPKIRSEAAKAILDTQFTVEGLPDTARITSVGTQRRIQGLVRMGWSMGHLAHRLGCDIAAVSALLRRPRVTARTYRAVDALYRDLHMTPGPHEAAERWAILRGWPPPLAWTEKTLDDPNGRPYGAVPVLDKAAQRRAEAVRLVLAGATCTEAGAVVGIHRSTVKRAVAAHRAAVAEGQEVAA
jgi:Homeodomain-like domain-containing protein